MKIPKLYISLVEAYYNANPAFVQSFIDKGYDVRLRIESEQKNQTEINQMIEAADICIANAKPVTGEMIDIATNLKLIAVFGAGYNQIELKKATERGIFVTNARGGNSKAVAEQTFSILLGLARQIVQDDRSSRKNGWLCPMGVELFGKTMGIIGLGAIGCEVARIARDGFNMRIIAYDPYLSEVQIRGTGAAAKSLEYLMKEADFISIHIPLTETTKYLIDSDKLSLMKANAYIVNMSRGGVIEEKALYKTLKSGQIAGAGLDVYENEPVSKDCPNPFIDINNTILTSHSGASTFEAIYRIGQLITDNVEDVLAGKRPRHNIVNGL